LLTDARQFDEHNPGGGYLETYLENAWLVNETDDWQSETDKVTLMTLHAAKGLEFPVAYLVAVEHGVLPHDRSTNDPSQIEEERRLAFVGITRAKEQLQLSYTVHRDFRGQRRRTVPSSFLLELPRDEMELTQLSSREPVWQEDEWESDFGDPEFDVETEDISQQRSKQVRGKETWSVKSARVTTAADLAGAKTIRTAQVSPEEFSQGMAVIHPEHGPGKIVALSGSGKNRRATVRFVTAGEIRFVLAHSPLRPARR